MNRNQSRYFSTAVRMDQALLALLEKKSFEYITVREICDTAEVNRSTFYLHYENTRELLEETTRYVIDSFLGYFSADTHRIPDSCGSCELSELLFITPEYLLPYLTFIRDNRYVFRTSVKHLGTMGFESVYRDLFRYILSPVLERFDFAENEREYVLKFYLTGITAVVLEWLNNDCRDSIESISTIIIQCVLGKSGIKAPELFAAPEQSEQH